MSWVGADDSSTSISAFDDRPEVRMYRTKRKLTFASLLPPLPVYGPGVVGSNFKETDPSQTSLYSQITNPQR